MLAFLLLWEITVRTGILSGRLVPLPSRLPAVFLAEIRSGIWLKMIGSSLRHYLPGLLAGSVLGIGMGITLSLVSVLDKLLSVLQRLLRPVPPLAWIPFAIIWFGISELAAAFIISIGVFWINFFASYGAVKGISPDLFELAASFGYKSRAGQLGRIIVPGALPQILTGLRTGFGQAWMTVVAAELFGIGGMGQRMLEASGLLAIEVVAVYMISISLLYGLTDFLFSLVQRRVLKWRS